MTRTKKNYCIICGNFIVSNKKKIKYCRKCMFKRKYEGRAKYSWSERRKRLKMFSDLSVKLVEKNHMLNTNQIYEILKLKDCDYSLNYMRASLNKLVKNNELKLIVGKYGLYYYYTEEKYLYLFYSKPLYSRTT